jgi:hypothetical protein
MRRDKAIIEKLTEIKDYTEKYNTRATTYQIKLIDKYRDVLERNGLLEEFKTLLDDFEKRKEHLKSGFDSIIPGGRGSGTLVQGHLRRNRDGSISSVSSYSRRS